MGDVNFDNIFNPIYLKYDHLTCNQYKMITEIVHIFPPVLTLWNPVCILHLKHMSVWTSHIASAQYLHVASGYGAGQPRFELLKSWGKMIRLGVKERLEPETGNLA